MTIERCPICGHRLEDHWVGACPDVEVGQRYELVEVVDRYPHFQVPPGRRGTISDISDGTISLRMDEHIYGCEEWDNEIVFSVDGDSLDHPEGPSAVNDLRQSARALPVPTVGDQVRAVFPNTSWGVGEVTHDEPSGVTASGELAKRYTVRHSEGGVGYFADGQIEVIE